MPNWCINIIQIFGEKENIKTIADIINNIDDNSDIGIFASLIGSKPINMTDEEYDKIGWYDVNIKYFGTKWDVSVEYCSIDSSDDYIYLNMDTAWSPPINFCIELAKKYSVKVIIDYEESGCDFAGQTIIQSDGSYEDKCYSYLEGLYNGVGCGDFEQELFNCIEWNMDDDNFDINEYIERVIPFATDKEKEKFKDLYLEMSE